MGIVLEGISHRDSTCDWSSLQNLLNDVILTAHSSELIDLVNVVRVWNKARFAWVAVSAQGDVGARVSVIVTSGSVNRTSLVSDEVFFDVLIGREWLTSVASQVVVGVTRDENLWSEINVWPCGISLDLDSV